MPHLFRSSRRTRIFLVISAALLLTDVIFVVANTHFADKALRESLKEEARHAEDMFWTVKERTLRNMHLIATLVAQDEEVRQLFLNGKRAVAAQDESRAAAARGKLLNEVAPTWRKVQAKFDARHLNFYLGPGALGFLRVRHPDTFGDSVDELRRTVVHTNARKAPHTGIETGRVYSGLRGVVPVFADAPRTGKRVHVGALEAGTPYSTMLDALDNKIRYGVAVLLDWQHVKQTMSDEYIKKRFPDGPREECGCVVVARSRDGVQPLMQHLPFRAPPGNRDKSLQPLMQHVSGRGGLLLKRDVELRPTAGGHTAMFHFPIDDYLGSVRPNRPPVGAVVMWRDATKLMAAHNWSQTFNILFALIGFLVLEILLYAGFYYAARRMQAEIDAKTAALRDSNAALERFAYSVSHDLQEPLRMISNFLELLQRRFGDDLPTKAREYVSRAHDGADRMRAMIDGLLAYSRVTTQGETLTPVSADNAAREALANLDATLEETGADVRVGDLPAVLADHTQLVRLFQNLVGNAVKYRHPDRPPVVRVAAEPAAKGMVRFTVADNGRGMAPEDRERAFQLFQRLDEDPQAPAGSGIGLAVCKRIVERHEGTIDVDGTPGEGTVFTFTLPAATDG